MTLEEFDKRILDVHGKLCENLGYYVHINMVLDSITGFSMFVDGHHMFSHDGSLESLFKRFEIFAKHCKKETIEDSVIKINHDLLEVASLA